MRFLILLATLVLYSCGSESSGDSVRASSTDTRLRDELSSTNWEMQGDGGILGYFFGANGQFLRVAFKTSPSVQAMGIRGRYSVSTDGNITMTAEQKSCSSFSDPAERTSPYSVEGDKLYLGTGRVFDFGKVSESFESRYGDTVAWGCISNDGRFTASPWTPY